MKKIPVVLLTLLLSVIFFAFSAKSANAAPLVGFNSECLTAVKNFHTATLTINTKAKMQPQGSTDTYIFTCLTVEKTNKTLCTTGDQALDTKLFDKSDYAEIKKIATKVGGVDGGQNPARQTNAGGTDFTSKVTWSDEYHPEIVHQFSWLQKALPVVDTGANNNGAGAQQQGTFDFDKAKGTASKCTIIKWDPRGYAFDAATLNPVKGITIMLSKGPSGGTFTDVPSGLGIQNPDVTKETNGQYSFYVDPGFYKLRITSPNAVIANLSAVNSAYRALLADDQENTHVYQPNQEIEEKQGTVAIANVPVTVTNPSLLITTLQILEKGVLTEGGQIRIFGRVSHPKSKMILTMNTLDETGTPVNLVKTDVTNELGEYDMLIEQNQTDATGKKLVLQNLNVSFELNSFYTTGTFSQKNNGISSLLGKIWSFISQKLVVNAAANTSFDVKPIPTYIEGIAYDANGVAIPGAIVGVYPTYSENPMYMTVADQDGHYKIGSQHLPQSAYNLRYKKPTGEIITIDTGTFIKQNAKFFATAGIKPFSSKNTTVAEDIKVQDFFATSAASTNLRPTDVVQKGSDGKYAGSSSNPSSRSGGAAAAPTGGIMSSGMQGIAMIVVVIFVLIMIGAGAFIMMKSKQQQMPPPQF